MTVEIKITGLDDLRREFSNLDAQFDDAVEDAIEETAMEIRNRVVTAIQRGPATGRQRPDGSIASAPGEPPMTDTGRLVGSIYMDIDPKAATVGSKLVYAQHLEYGTRKMRPRPIWVKVAKEEERKMRDRVIDNLRAALK